MIIINNITYVLYGVMRMIYIIPHYINLFLVTCLVQWIDYLGYIDICHYNTTILERDNMSQILQAGGVT
jgi:hypothetical protein